MNLWSFIGMEPQGIASLSEASKKRIVNGPGIYVLFTADGHAYRYPKGDSPIFYIGMSDALCSRLDTHRRRVQSILNGSAKGIEWPRYEYAAAHGCKIAAFPLVSGLQLECGDVEDDVVALFACTYGAPPVANGAANRDKVLRRKSLKPPLGLSAQAWLRSLHDMPM